MPPTPGPWHVGPHYRADVESRHGRICECIAMGSLAAVANAAFIVRACNSHDELLDALKACSALLHDRALDDASLAVLLTCDAAIAKATQP